MGVCRLLRIATCRYWKGLYEVVIPEAHLYNRAFRAALSDELREMVQELEVKGGMMEAPALPWRSRVLRAMDARSMALGCCRRMKRVIGTVSMAHSTSP